MLTAPKPVEPTGESKEPPASPCDLTVVVPVYNEEDNVEPLYKELTETLGDGDQQAGLDGYEIIFVDDGSTDRSLERLVKLAKVDRRVIVLELRRNFGQTAAMAAGIDQSRGRVIVPIDADLQNDPKDIPLMLAKLNGPPAFDIVSGWRRDRQDKWLSRRVPSQIANAIIRRFTNVPIHDFGCTLKAYRREVLAGVSLSSDLHRFLPALAAWQGARITEFVVHHRPRTHGQTKYGLRRTFRVLLDLITVKFLGSYMAKPLYFFARIGLVPLLLAFVLLGVAVGQKYGHFGQPNGLNLNRNILVSLSALLVFLSVQSVLLGVVCELLVRIYHDVRGCAMYGVRQRYQQDERSGCASGAGATPSDSPRDHAAAVRRRWTGTHQGLPL